MAETRLSSNDFDFHFQPIENDNWYASNINAHAHRAIPLSTDWGSTLHPTLSSTTFNLPFRSSQDTQHRPDLDGGHVAATIQPLFNQHNIWPNVQSHSFAMLRRPGFILREEQLDSTIRAPQLPPNDSYDTIIQSLDSAMDFSWDCEYQHHASIVTNGQQLLDQHTTWPSVPDTSFAPPPQSGFVMESDELGHPIESLESLASHRQSGGVTTMPQAGAVTTIAHSETCQTLPSGAGTAILERPIQAFVHAQDVGTAVNSTEARTHQSVSYRAKYHQARAARHSAKPAGQHRCPVESCNARFGRKFTLERHMANVHHQQAYRCPACSETFTRKDSTQRHYVEQHGIKSACVECPDCGKRVRKRSIEEHTVSQACQRAQAASDVAAMQRMAPRIDCMGAVDPVIAAEWSFSFYVASLYRNLTMVDKTCLRAQAAEFYGVAMRALTRYVSDSTESGAAQLYICSDIFKAVAFVLDGSHARAIHNQTVKDMRGRWTPYELKSSKPGGNLIGHCRDIVSKMRYGSNVCKVTGFYRACVLALEWLEL